MNIHPTLQALRSDDTPQRQAQAALFAARDAWRAGNAMAQVEADLAAFATARPLAECPALNALFDDANPAARTLADSFCAAMACALDAEPLGHVPLRHFTDGTVSTLLLAQAEGVSLTLAALDGALLARRPAPVSVSFPPTTSWEHVLCGSGEGELLEMRGTLDAGQINFHRKAITLSPGRVVVREGSRQALVLGRVAGCLVSLRLTRRHAVPAPTREVELASGRVVHQSAGSPRESRQELMVNLLGRMGRADAAPVLAEMAQETGAAGLRWQALRECLTLDTLAGFRALGAVAQSGADPLAPAAGALRAQLIATHPQLAEI